MKHALRGTQRTLFIKNSKSTFSRFRSSSHHDYTNTKTRRRVWRAAYHQVRPQTSCTPRDAVFVSWIFPESTSFPIISAAALGGGWSVPRGTTDASVRRVPQEQRALVNFGDRIIGWKIARNMCEAVGEAATAACPLIGLQAPDRRKHHRVTFGTSPLPNRSTKSYWLGSFQTINKYMWCLCRVAYHIINSDRLRLFETMTSYVSVGLQTEAPKAIGWGCSRKSSTRTQMENC